jgi:hypothetical protein
VRVPVALRVLLRAGVADTSRHGRALGWGSLSAFSLVLGALLVMLVDSMIPDATRQAGRTAGLVTTLGFAVATVLSATS